MWGRGWGSVNKTSTQTHMHIKTHTDTETAYEMGMSGCPACSSNSTSFEAQTGQRWRNAPVKCVSATRCPALPSPYCLSPLPPPPPTDCHPTPLTPCSFASPTRLCSAFSRVFWHAQSAKHKQKPNLTASVCLSVCA